MAGVWVETAGPGQTAGKSLVAEAHVREDQLSVARARAADGRLIPKVVWNRTGRKR